MSIASNNEEPSELCSATEGLALGTQPRAVSLKDRVVAHPDQYIQVEDLAQLCASATNHSNATELTTVLVERCYRTSLAA
jgi:hypothetical protein